MTDNTKGPRPFGRFARYTDGDWQHTWEVADESPCYFVLGSKGYVHWANFDITGAEIEEARAQLKEQTNV